MSETLRAKLDYLLKHSNGTMPIRMALDTPEQAKAAKSYLSAKPGGSLIVVCLRDPNDEKKWTPA
jgi:hypothetical protein